MPRKPKSRLPLDMLDELRAWCVRHGVTKVTVEGISLELGETAFWDNAQPTQAEPPQGPANAPWDIEDEETPQAKARREYAAKAERIDSGVDS
jgi:hypothetical protein